MRLRDQVLTTAATNVASAALALVTSVVLARGLGPELRGTFFVLQAYFGIAAMGVGLSVPTIMTVLVSRGEFSLAQVHSAALALSVVLGSLGGGATLTLLYTVAPVSGVSSLALVLFLSTMPLAIYKAMWGGMFLGLSKIPVINAFNLIDATLVLGAISVPLVVLHTGIDGVLFALVAQSALMCVVGVGLVVRERGLSWRLSPACLTELLRQGWRQHLASALGQLFMRADAVILARLAPAAAIGQYAVARGLSERILMALSPVSQVMFPRIASAQAAQGSWYACATFRVMGVLGLAAAAGFVLTAPLIVPLLYGAAFGEAAGLTQVLAPSFALLGVIVPVNLWIVGSLKRPTLNAAVNGVALLLVAIVGWGLVSLYGSWGMAWATFLSFGLTLVFAVWLANVYGLGLRRVLPEWGEFVRLWRSANVPGLGQSTET